MRDILESTVVRLLADHSTPALALACENGDWPAALWQAVADSGFALAAAPESRGGAGASWDELYPVLVACGRHHAPVPLPEAIFANWLLGIAGIDALPGPLSFAAQATLTMEGGRVSGAMAEVPWGRHVDHVVAITSDEQPMLVLLTTAGAVNRRRSLNVAGEPRDGLDFDAVAAVASAPLPDGIAPSVMACGGAMLRAAQSAGALQRLLELCTAHAGERVQFGKAIGSFQAIGHQIAVLAEQVALTSVAAEAACAESGDAGLALLPIAAAKVCSAEAAGVAAAIAHAVHGAIGFSHEHVLHLTTRRLWAWRSEYGSTTDWAQRIGRAVCAGGASAFWPAITAGSLPGLNPGAFR